MSLPELFLATFLLFNLAANFALGFGHPERPLRFSRQRAQSSTDWCTAFRPDGIENLTLVAATRYPERSLVNITGLYQSIETASLPSFCREYDNII